MADGIYALFVESMMNKEIDLDTDTIKVMLVDTADYTVSLAAHHYLTSVPAAARVATATLANKTITAGVFDADDVTFSTVTGDPCEAIVIYQDTGTEATSHLICYITSATGLPVTPQGGSIMIVWSSGANKIFKIG